MSDFTSEENIFFNADNLQEFSREFKHLTRTISGYVIVQLGVHQHNDLHPLENEILRIGNQFSLTEGLSNLKVLPL